jgi:hypothetical protein
VRWRPKSEREIKIKEMIKKQYFKEMKSRIKSIVGVFLTVGVAKVNICSF